MLFKLHRQRNKLLLPLLLLLPLPLLLLLDAHRCTRCCLACPEDRAMRSDAGAAGAACTCSAPLFWLFGLAYQLPVVLSAPVPTCVRRVMYSAQVQKAGGTNHTRLLAPCHCLRRGCHANVPMQAELKADDTKAMVAYTAIA